MELFHLLSWPHWHQKVLACARDQPKPTEIAICPQWAIIKLTAMSLIKLSTSSVHLNDKKKLKYYNACYTHTPKKLHTRGVSGSSSSSSSLLSSSSSVTSALASAMSSLRGLLLVTLATKGCYIYRQKISRLDKKIYPAKSFKVWHINIWRTFMHHLVL